MSKTLYKIWLFGLLLTLSQVSSALSLGEINVISTFAQPFLAEIKLPSYTDEELESVQIHMASKEQFAEQKIDKLPVLRNFLFSVEERKNGVVYIKVYTKTPVKELSLSFLIEVTWKNGRIIKSYDVLLTPEAITQFWEKRAQEMIAELNVEFIDLDTITPPTQEIAQLNQKADANNKDGKEKENTTVIRQPTQVATAKKDSEDTVKPRKRKKSRLKRTKDGGLEYSPVGSGESLSLIAEHIRSGEDISLNQIMVALFEENRRAFRNNDINRLMSGYALKIANTKSFTSISKKEAFQLARKYMEGPLVESEPTMIAKNSKTGDKSQTEVEAVDEEPVKPEIFEPEGNRLEISSANEDIIPPEIMEQIKSEQIATIEEELEIAQQSAQQLQSENKELKDRIVNLELQLDTTAESLFLATIEQAIVQDSPAITSLTQQDQNLIVTNTDLAMAGTEKLSLMQRIEKYQTAISISSAALLSLTIIGFRKKEQILNVVHSLKDKLSKSKNDEDMQFS